MADDRNYNITNKICSILNEVKGFEVASGNPRAGKMIVRYEGKTFYLSLEPVFNDNKEGKEEEKKSFEEVARSHQWIFRT